MNEKPRAGAYIGEESAARHRVRAHEIVFAVVDEPSKTKNQKHRRSLSLLKYTRCRRRRCRPGSRCSPSKDRISRRVLAESEAQKSLDSRLQEAHRIALLLLLRCGFVA